ncbi:hypothetical protein M514_27360 [Trichuris suis]|uniref:RING-type domain-containing protein n=1 Tax=Trichuris suis TaxID=68888 RepID=A0A085MTA6_9BILA|nr:hypothetical protein M514_27360 [Trichuris suis]
MSSNEHLANNSNASRVQLAASENDECQRSLLTKAILMDELECRICLEIVKSEDPIWSCTLCYNVFHFDCVKHWAASSVEEPNASVTSNPGRPCPTCQASVNASSLKAKCFCGKVEGPIERSDPNTVPHSCGSVCGRTLGKPGICTHLCPLICHPGSCPPCGDSVELSCFCSATKRVMKCRTAELFSCGNVCNKFYKCQRHKCQRECHSGPCLQSMGESSNFAVAFINNYFFPGCVLPLGFPTSNRLTLQTFVRDSSTSCGQPCGRKRRCGVHYCFSRCHPGECLPCKMDPSVVQTCPCGFTPLKSLGVDRKACTDPIPTCGSICKSILPCSLPGMN